MSKEKLGVQTPLYDLVIESGNPQLIFATIPYGVVCKNAQIDNLLVSELLKASVPNL